MADKIELLHSSGPITLTEAQATVVDDQYQFTGLVDAATWDRIEQEDIFGAVSRTRSPGELPSGNQIRITIGTEQQLPPTATAVAADMFVILDAMRSIDLAELGAAGIEGEVWEGIAFSDPQPWSAALHALSKEGFLLINGLPSATTMRRDADEVSVEFRHHEDAQVVHAQAVYALPAGGAVPVATFELLNRINTAVKFGVVMIDAGDLIVREAIPDQLGEARPALIAERSLAMVSILGEILEAVLRVASGELNAAEGLEVLFG
jgi:hypothetical protein